MIKYMNVFPLSCERPPPEIRAEALGLRSCFDLEMNLLISFCFDLWVAC